MKCRVCNEDFEQKEWQVKAYDYRCIPCKRKQQNEFNANDPQFKEKHKRRYQDRKEWYKNYYKKKQLDAVYVFKKKARRKVQTAIENGTLIKPEYCDECHKRGKIEAHHTNYKEALNVQWKCKKCHEKAHYGERRNS